MRWRGSAAWAAALLVGCSLTGGLDDIAGSPADAGGGSGAADASATGGASGIDGGAGTGASPGTGSSSGDAAAVDGDGSGSPDAPPSCTVPISDGFDDGTVAAQWDVWKDNGLTLSEKFGRLYFYVPASTPDGAWVGIEAQQSHDLTGCSTFVHVLDVPTDPNVQLSFGANSGLMDGVHITLDAGELNLEVKKGGTYSTLKKVAFSATAHAWWRIREASGHVYWEASTDGKAWVELASVAAPFAFNAVKVWVGVGTSGTTSQAAQASVDQFNVPP